MMSSKTTNTELIEVVKLLKRKANVSDAAIWDDLAERLRKSKHSRISVNISRINRHSTADEVVVVPGKVLGSGVLAHKVHVAAFAFSKQARERIEKAGGTCLTLQTLVQKSPKGSGLKIIG